MSYVIDYLNADPSHYVLRAPTPLARLICMIGGRWFGRTWDYAPTPEGF